jgi:hypothetical protein
MATGCRGSIGRPSEKFSAEGKINPAVRRKMAKASGRRRGDRDQKSHAREIGKQAVGAMLARWRAL